MSRKKLTYKEAGVDIEAGEEFVRGIRGQLERTFSKYVIENYGGFAGLYDFGAYLRDKAIEKFVEEIKRKYGEKRAPYILAGYWLQARRNRLEIEAWRKTRGRRK